ncbi:rod shape-determining protein MreC [Poseidonibacter sp.]|uniref:rod shape-determining protein MreC n=1 Tax=Poseidonibacter sp. TaxID=2321188 RepID=UPI00359D0987
MRKLLFFILLIIISLSYLFDLDKLVVKKLTIFNDLKLAYINKVISISTTVEKYFSQASNIERLRAENNDLLEYKILYNTSQKKLDSINELITSINLNEDKSKVTITKVLSYINYNDFTKVWLDHEKKDDTILGLITENYAAGIVVRENDRAVALLNGNKKSSYAVFIGKNKIPGIFMSSNDIRNVVIKYIPIWAKVNVGDEIITSGMDNIFFEGLKVGKVTKVTKYPDMQIAEIKPYANVLEKKYFYIYEENSRSDKKANN